MTSLICGAVFIGFLLIFGGMCAANDRSPRTVAYRASYTQAKKGGYCCGTWVKDLTAHEAGHTAVAKGLGYRVNGAVVNKDGTGFTSIPGWENNPRHTMIMAAAGAAGEKLVTGKFELNGAKNWAYTDKWYVYSLAAKVAKQRGITSEQAVAEAQREATRLLSQNMGHWREANDKLGRDGKFGSTS